MNRQIVAFDIGDKRIGVAHSDPFGEYAVPSDTYFRTGSFPEDVRAVAEIAKLWGAQLIVCGLPLNADGTESVQTAKTRKFIAALAEETDVPVCCEDERFSTRAAREDLISMGISVKKDKRKKSIDSLAATYILESYLSNHKKGDSKMKEEQNNYEEDENVVELIDEEGNTIPYEHLMTFEYKDEWYVALAPVAEEIEENENEDEEEEEDIFIYHIVGEEDNETLEVIEDEALLDEVFEEFCRQYDDVDEDEDAE